LEHCNRGYVNNVVPLCAAREIGARLGQAEQNLAVGFRPRQILDQLGADVAAVAVVEADARRERAA